MTDTGNSSWPRYQSYSLNNFRSLPEMHLLTEKQKFEMEVVGHVLPFRTNNYVVQELINWQNVPDDPIFRLTFPQRNMLLPHHFERMAHALKSGKSRVEIQRVATGIREALNPHPAGQREHNVPLLNGKILNGVQHKYRETVLFFPSHGQTCHAYCSFCFRWPQFVGMSSLKFATKETQLLIDYLRLHPEVTDVLFTGGDPMIMTARVLKSYVEPLLAAELPNLQTIRFGTKALSYWPYKFFAEPDSDDLFELLRKIGASGKHAAVMAHFSHPRELETEAVREAVLRIRATGAQIRTQSPILRNINDRSEIWAEMWKAQTKLGCVPYYMFIVRDTGAQHYFGVPVVKAWRIFAAAYRQVSGISRTVRGPIMSATEGKVQVVGMSEILGEKVLVLTRLQTRDPQASLLPYFAEYDEKAFWVDELMPWLPGDSAAAGEPFAGHLAA